MASGLDLGTLKIGLMIDGIEKTQSNLKTLSGNFEDLTKEGNKSKGMLSGLKESFKTGISDGISPFKFAIGDLISEGIQMCIQAVGELIAKTGEYAMQIKQASDMTSFSQESLQEWDYILKQTGGDLDTLTGSMMDFNEIILDASNGAGDGAEVFGELGISIYNVDGSLRSTESVFNDTIYALQNMTDETKKTAYSTMLLSTGGEQLASVLDMTNEELQTLKGNANIVSNEDITAINKFTVILKDFTDGVSKELMGILADLGTLLSPIVYLLGAILVPLLKIVGVITNIIATPFRQGIKEAEETVKGGTKQIESTYEAHFETIEDMNKSHNETMNQLSSESQGYMKKELSEYEKKLKEQFDETTRSGRIAIEKRLKNKQEALEKEYRMEEEHNKRIQKLRENGNYNTYNGSTTRFANGTKSARGGWSVVGEVGRELMYVPPKAQIFNSTQTKEMIGGNSMNFYGGITVQADNVQQFMNELQILTRRGAVV